MHGATASVTDQNLQHRAAYSLVLCDWIGALRVAETALILTSLQTLIAILLSLHAWFLAVCQAVAQTAQILGVLLCAALVLQ